MIPRQALLLGEVAGNLQASVEGKPILQATVQSRFLELSIGGGAPAPRH